MKRRLAEIAAGDWASAATRKAIQEMDKTSLRVHGEEVEILKRSYLTLFEEPKRETCLKRTGGAEGIRVFQT